MTPLAQAQVIQPLNGDPFVGMLETPVTSAPIVANYLSNLPAYRTGVSPLLRGVEIGLAHGFLLPGPFIKVPGLAGRQQRSWVAAAAAAAARWQQLQQHGSTTQQHPSSGNGWAAVAAASQQQGGFPLILLEWRGQLARGVGGGGGYQSAGQKRQEMRHHVRIATTTRSSRTGMLSGAAAQPPVAGVPAAVCLVNTAAGPGHFPQGRSTSASWTHSSRPAWQQATESPSLCLTSVTRCC